MKMKWQFATILAAIYAVLPVGAVEGVKGLTPEEVARINAQLQSNHPRDTGPAPANGRPVPANPTPTEQEKAAADRLNRIGGGPLALLKLTALQQSQSSVDPRKQKELQAAGVRTVDKAPKAGKQPKRQKPSKRQAKSR